MKDIDGVRGTPSLPGPNFTGMALIALLANLTSTELHECIHLIVGRLCRLPAHFLSLTSVGVDPSIAAKARPSALALMNGVAPLATMGFGVVALVVMPGLRRRAPAVVTAFVAWCAIFAILYIGLQMMTAALPIRLRGNGADTAAVLGGYFGASIGLRTAISILGLILFMVSGFWLGRAVSGGPGDAPRRFTRQHLRGLPAWRLAIASALGLLLVVVAARGASLMAHGTSGGFFSLLIAIWLWGVMMAVLVRWQTPGAREVRDRWIAPGLLASLLLLTLGLFTHVDDLYISATIFVIPLIATAWGMTWSPVAMAN